MTEFFRRYPQEVGKPFVFRPRVEACHEDVLRKLKEKKFRDTLRINQEINPDVISISSYYPFPGPDLYDYLTLSRRFPKVLRKVRKGF